MFLALAAAALIQTPPSAFHFEDDIKNRRFVLTFKNVGRKTLCLSPAMWPNERGFIPLTSSKIAITVEGRSFPLDTFIENFGTDMIRVRPRSTARAYLNYSAFKLPDVAASKRKTLRLKPATVPCA